MKWICCEHLANKWLFSRLTDLGSVLAAPESDPNILGSTPFTALVAATSPGPHMDPGSTPHKVFP